jgi:DNA-binding protein HU-beta
MDATTALAIYRAEKDKALRERRVSHVQLMAEAQEAFRKMLADAQLARKGGRPKGSTNAASAAPAASVVTTQTVAVTTSKLVLKPTKAAPSKSPEKVIASAEPAAKARTAPRKAAVKVTAAKPEKRSAEKHRAQAKSKPVAKAAKRVSAPARKGSAKKTAAPRKQAAARERKAKSRKL